jgi:phosphoserine phosphatase
LAVGDGANDLLMLQAAGLGVAYRGKPLLKQSLPTWVDISDLTALLYMQGWGDK